MFELPIPHTLQTIKNSCGGCALRGVFCAMTPHCPALADIPFMDQSFTSVAEMELIGDHYGLPLALETGITLDWIRNKLLSGVPVILLGNYGYLNPGYPFTGNHWFCAIGFDDDGFKINDSLRTQPVYVTNATLEASLAHVVASIDSKPVTHLVMYPSEASLMPPLKGLGRNSQATFIPDFPAYLEDLKASPPPAMVVIDHLARALAIKAALPQTAHIFRYFFSGGDDNSWNKITPAQWAEIYEPACSQGLIGYADNEPGFNETSINWLLGVANICVQRDWKCVLGNWSVGMPHESEWWKAEALLRYVAAHSDLLSIGLHEYCPHLTSYEFGRHTNPAQWGAIDTNNKPYLMGRFRWMLDFCKAKGFKSPNIYITEWGWDSIKVAEAWQTGLPGYEHGAGYPICETAWNQWKPANMNTGQYAARQLGWIWKELYQKHPQIKGVCGFCDWGVGAWQTNFAFGNKRDFIIAARSEDFSVGTQSTDTFDMVLHELVGEVNYRATPNGTVLGKLVRGDVFIPTTEVVKEGNYYWRKGTTAKYGVGWAAVKDLSGNPVSWKMTLRL